MWPVDAVQPRSGGIAPGTAPTTSAHGRAALERRVGEDVEHERRERQRRGQRVGPDAHERQRDHRAEDAEARARSRASAAPPAAAGCACGASARRRRARVHVERVGRGHDERDADERDDRARQVCSGDGARQMPAAVVISTIMVMRGLPSATRSRDAIVRRAAARVCDASCCHLGRQRRRRSRSRVARSGPRAIEMQDGAVGEDRRRHAEVRRHRHRVEERRHREDAERDLHAPPGAAPRPPAP